MNSPEYRTFAALTNDLNLAVRSNLVSVGGYLMSCGLITSDDYDSLRNRMHPESDRAANLVTLVLRKIQQDPGNYHKFVSVLEQDRWQNNTILSKLKQQYEYQRSNQQGHRVAQQMAPVTAYSSGVRPDSQQGAIEFSSMTNMLNRVIEHKPLGRIAGLMSEWEGIIADELDLTSADVATIKGKHQNELRLQVREALKTWKQRKGNAATYAKLIQVFEAAGYQAYADNVRRICTESDDGVPQQTTPVPPNTTRRTESDGGAQQAAAVPSSTARVPEVKPEPQPEAAAFSVSMSDEEFIRFLKGEGLTEKDCGILKDNGIGAKVFVTDITEKDINDPDLKFSFGGKKVLKRILQKLTTHTDGDQNGPLEFNENDKKQISVDGGRGKITVDYYGPHKIDRSSPRTIKFSFGSVEPKIGARSSKIYEYDMTKFPHGIALIINNETFKDHEKRKGTKVDERNLTHAFRYLGYDVEVHREVEKDKMLDIMSEMGRRDHKKYDSFVCCILSHGEAGHVFGTDSRPVSLHELTEKIDAQQCMTLRGKPKLFFLQACRGDFTELKVTVGSDGEMLPKRDALPEASDFYFGHATPLGYKAWRDSIHGSWYISELCRTLCEMFICTSLDEIMAEVCRRVTGDDKHEHMGYKMTPERTSRLSGNVFF